jgi:hypothetical protein
MSQIKAKQVQPASTTSGGVLTSAAQAVFGQKTFDSLAASTVAVNTFQNLVGSTAQYVSNGKPNGVITANIGSVCIDSTNGVQWFKQSGAGNTGWVSAPGCVYVAANQAITAATNTQITGLTVSQPANTIAVYSGVLYWSTSAVNRCMQMAITSTGGTLNGAEYIVTSGANGTAASASYAITAFSTRLGPTTTSTTGVRLAYFNASVITAGAAATVGLAGSISAATGTITVRAGSYLEYKFLN